MHKNKQLIKSIVNTVIYCIAPCSLLIHINETYKDPIVAVIQSIGILVISVPYVYIQGLNYIKSIEEDNKDDV